MHNKLLILSLISCVVHLVFVPLSEGVTQVLAHVIMISICLYPVIWMLEHATLKINLSFFLLLLCVFMAVVTDFHEIKTGPEEGILRQVGLFCAFYWIISLRQEDRYKINFKWLIVINYILCAVILLYSYGPFDFRYARSEAWVGVVFTMGLPNPNAAAAYVMFAIVILIIQISNTKHRWVKVLNVVVIGMLSYVMVMLRTRSVFVALFVTMLLRLFRAKKWSRAWMPRLIMLVPLAMILGHLMLAQMDIDITIFGKTLASGRADLYETVFQEVRQAPLSYIFGRVGYYRLDNLHNAPLAIFANLGILGFLVWLPFWTGQLRYMNSIYSTRVQEIALIYVWAFIIHSSAEVMFMVGMTPYCLFMIVMTKLAKDEFVLT